MPSESAPPPPLSRTPSLYSYSAYKCDRCGARCVAGTASTSASVGVAAVHSGPEGGPRPAHALGRSYSDNVPFGDRSADVHEAVSVTETADGLGQSIRDAVDMLICGTCATSVSEQEDILAPLTSLSGSVDRHLNGRHSMGAVGLGLSLGRAAPPAASAELSPHGGGEDEGDPHRPPSVGSDSDTCSPDLSTLHISPPIVSEHDIEPLSTQPVSIPNHSQSGFQPAASFPQSLPTPAPLPWTTTRPNLPATELLSEASRGTKETRGKGRQVHHDLDDRPYQPLLDVTSERVSNAGRGALYAGSVFRGTQTSGRSAYDVEIRFLEVNLPRSTCSGYLTISNLTDTHPSLTTFFTAELIGEEYGFITGGRWGASEHDDLRHWGRFEQFRRPATRTDLIRPELYLRDPVPLMGWGGTPAATPAGMPGTMGTGYMGSREQDSSFQPKGKERDFVFMRIKEKFLVPDHTVKDISGASFAGFYYAMLDLTPPADYVPYTSPVSPRSSLPPMSPSSPTTANSSYAYSSEGPRNTNHDRPPTSAGITGYFSSAFGRRASVSAHTPTPGVVLDDGTVIANGNLGTSHPSRPPAAGWRRASSGAAGQVGDGITLVGRQGTPAASLPRSPTAQMQMPPRRRRESRDKVTPEAPREATIRGYYFHSLNQEPFQELFLTHVPNKSCGTFEMR